MKAKVIGPKCITCEHCTDEWWDYTNGPYMWFCDKMVRGSFCTLHNEDTSDKSTWIEQEWSNGEGDSSLKLTDEEKDFLINLLIDEDSKNLMGKLFGIPKDFL